MSQPCKDICSQDRLAKTDLGQRHVDDAIYDFGSTSHVGWRCSCHSVDNRCGHQMADPEHSDGSAAYHRDRPFFNLTLGFNTGVSFGMFSDLFRELPLLLAGIKVGIAAALLIWALRTEKFIETVGLGLIAGGAGGNIVDRIAQGAVTDFLDFHVGGWHWPTFNMADVTITVGVVLLVGASVWPAPASLRERQRQAMDQR